MIIKDLSIKNIWLHVNGKWYHGIKSPVNLSYHHKTWPNHGTISRQFIILGNIINIAPSGEMIHPPNSSLCLFLPTDYEKYCWSFTHKFASKNTPPDSVKAYVLFQ